MLQVDENIGGRQDQKNNGLTKTLAVGLLMVVGCFAVGFFSATVPTATTATTATTTAHTPNGNYLQTNSFAKVLFQSLPTFSPSMLNSCIFFFTKHNPALNPAKSLAWSPIYSIQTLLLQTRHRTIRTFGRKTIMAPPIMAFFM